MPGIPRGITGQDPRKGASLTPGAPAAFGTPRPTDKPQTALAADTQGEEEEEEEETAEEKGQNEEVGAHLQHSREVCKSKEDRRLEWMLVSLNEKLERVHDHLASQMDIMPRSLKMLSGDVVDLLASMQASMSSQQALLARVVVQQEQLLEVCGHQSTYVLPADLNPVGCYRNCAQFLFAGYHLLDVQRFNVSGSD